MEIRDLLSHAPASFGPEYITYRGIILQGMDPGTFVLQPDPSSRSESAIFQTADVIAEPWRVPQEHLLGHEQGQDLYQVRIRMGARAKHLRERLYHVGRDPKPQYVNSPSTATSKTQRRSIGQILKKAPVSFGEEFTVFRGAILASASDDEFILQPDPSSRTERAIIRLEDLVEHEAIEKAAKETLGLNECDPDIFFIKVRSGSVLRRVREDEMIVQVPPSPPGYGGISDVSVAGPDPDVGGCSCSQQPKSQGGDGLKRGTAVAAGIPCKEKVGACGPGLPGRGYPCASPGAFCRVFGFNPRSGTCRTVSSWFFNCECDCVKGTVAPPPTPPVPPSA